MRWGVLAVLAAIGLFWLYVRLAPTDVAAVHVAAAPRDPGDYPDTGAFTAVRAITTPPEGVLTAIERVALATPRTTRLAGDVASGMMTFETRTRFGFPDYTTVSIIPAGTAPGGNAGPLVMLTGRLRFGVADLDVNRTRIEGWLAQLGPLTAAP